jgi:hypothetical protein
MDRRNTLDASVARYRAQLFAETTKATYKSHLRAYIHFCLHVRCHPIPATPTTICWYAAYLAWSRAFSTVGQYLNIVRIVHQEFGLPNPLLSWELKTVMGGIKREKGDNQEQKAPILLEHLCQLHDILQGENIFPRSWISSR